MAANGGEMMTRRVLRERLVCGMECSGAQRASKGAYLSASFVESNEDIAVNVLSNVREGEGVTSPMSWRTPYIAARHGTTAKWSYAVSRRREMAGLGVGTENRVMGH